MAKGIDQGEGAVAGRGKNVVDFARSSAPDRASPTARARPMRKRTRAMATIEASAPSSLDPEKKQQVLKIFNAILATEERDRRRQMRAAGPQGRAIHRATKRLCKAVQDVDKALDSLRVVAGLPAPGSETLD